MTLNASNLIDIFVQGSGENAETRVAVDLTESITSAVNVANDELVYINADSSSAYKDNKTTIANLVAAIAGSSLTATNGVLAYTNDAGYTTNVGDITSVGAGTGLSGGGVSGGTSLALDLDDLPAGATDPVGTDSLPFIVGGVSKKYTLNDFPLSAFNNDSGWTNNTGTTTASNSQTFTNKSGSNNQWTNDAGYITSYVNTTYSAGSLLDLSSTTFNVDLSELTDMTQAWVNTTDEFVVLDSGSQKRKKSSEIFGSNAFTSTTIPTNNNELTNGAGYTTNVGTLTEITSSAGLDGSGTSGSIALSLDLKEIADAGVLVAGDTLVVVDDTTTAQAQISNIPLSIFSNDANWNNYTLPLSASGTRGGVKIGYGENGKNYPVELSSEKMFVNVPWTDTVYGSWSVKANSGTAAAVTSGTTLDFKQGGATTVSRSGNDITISSTNTTYSVGDGGLTKNNFTDDDHTKLDGIATGATNTSAPHYTSAIPAITATVGGLMANGDAIKFASIATGANNYSLPTAASGTRGGVKIGYAENAKNYPVELALEKMFVNVPWTDTVYGSWSVKANSGTAAAVTSGTTLDFKQGGATTVSRSGNDITISSTNTTYSVGDGGLTKNNFTDDDHTKLNGIETAATADQTAAEIRTLVGTGNGNFVPAQGTAGHFLKHDGTFGIPAYTTNTDTNYYATGLGFATGTGVLTLTVSGASNPTVDLDGRYLLDSGDTMTGTLTIANNIQILGAADGVAYSFTGDTDTGVQSGGTNTLQLTTGGTKAVDFDGNQLATFTGNVVVSGSTLLESTYTKLQTYAASDANGIVLRSGSSQANSRNWGIYTNYSAWGSFDIRGSNANGTAVAHTLTGFTVTKDMNVGIGSAAPGAYKLYVAGTTYLGNDTTLGSGKEFLLGGTTEKIFGTSNYVVIDGANGTILRDSGANKVIQNGNLFRPDANNTIALGTIDQRWASTWSVLGNFSGVLTCGSTVTWSGGGSANANTAYGWGNHASAGYTSNTGTVTNVTVGLGLDVSSSTTTPSLTLDLNELGQAGVLAGTDCLVVLDGADTKKETISGINLSIFNNNSGWTSNAGTVTSVAAGTGLTISSGSGSVNPTLATKLDELTNMSAAVVGGTDQLILLDNGTDSRKTINTINLGQFNNDQGWTSNAGDITSVGAGTGLSGGGTSGGTSLALDLDDLPSGSTDPVGSDSVVFIVGGVSKKYTLNDFPLSAFDNNSGWTNNTGTTTASNSQTFTNKGGNISQWTNNSGYTTNAGTVTSVTGGTGIDSTGGTTPSITLDLGELSNTVMSVGTDYIPFIDGSSTGTSKKDKFSDVIALIAGSNLSASSGVLNATNTTYSAGTLLDLSSTTFNVDLSEATTATDFGSSDYMIYWDSGSSRAEKTLPANIDLDEFDNDWSQFLGVANYLHIQGRFGSTTNGGTAGTADSWQTKPLNTIIVNNISASLNSNVITLPVGEYYCRFWSNAYYVGDHQARLRRTTSTATTLLHGSSAFSNQSSSNLTIQASEGSGYFNLSGSGSKNVELQYIVGTANSSDHALGRKSSYSVSGHTYNIYSSIEFWKIG